MSYVSKSLFIAAILFTSMSPAMVFSQEPSSNKTGNVAEVHDSLSTEPTSILIMRPELDSLRTMAAAIVARNKHIRIVEPGAASGEPKQLEAELWLQPEVPSEIVEKIIGDVAKFGIVRIQLVRPFLDPDNTVVITAPANTPQGTIKDLQGKLTLPEGFKCIIQIRENNPSASITLPQEIQSQITQLEVELAVQKLKLGAEHPSIKSLEERIAALRKTEESEPKPPVTVLPLRHAKATDVAEKFKQLDLGPVDAIVVDERTNSVMIRGTERQIKDIEQLIEVLDAEVSPTGHGEAAEATTPAAGPTADGASPLGSGGFGERSPPAETPIAEYRRRLNDLEKPVLELAGKVRTAETSLGKEHPEFQKRLANLRALVQQTFATRQEIQRAELAEFTRRLERMKQAIETREKIADKIVDRRVEELLYPETNWNSASQLPREPLIGNKKMFGASDFAEKRRLSEATSNSAKSDSESRNQSSNENLTVHAVVLDGWPVPSTDSILLFAIRNQIVTPAAAIRLQELVNQKKLVVVVNQQSSTKQGQSAELMFGAANTMTITPFEEAGKPVLDVSIAQVRNRLKEPDTRNGKAIETFRHEFRADLSAYGAADSLFYFDTGDQFRLVRLSVSKVSTNNGEGNSEPPQLPIQQAEIRCKTVEAEVKIRLPGKEQQTLYWHGFPLHTSNRIILVPDVVADIEIVRAGIDSLVIYANRSPHRARVVSTKSSPNLLMVELDGKVRFDSVPFSKQNTKQGDSIQAFRYEKGNEFFAMKVGEGNLGVQPMQVDKAINLWAGTVFLNQTQEECTGIGLAKDEIVPATALSEWKVE